MLNIPGAYWLRRVGKGVRSMPSVVCVLVKQAFIFELAISLNLWGLLSRKSVS